MDMSLFSVLVLVPDVETLIIAKYIATNHIMESHNVEISSSI